MQGVVMFRRKVDSDVAKPAAADITKVLDGVARPGCEVREE